jgi:hypothetical protein
MKNLFLIIVIILSGFSADLFAQSLAAKQKKAIGYTSPREERRMIRTLDVERQNIRVENLKNKSNNQSADIAPVNNGVLYYTASYSYFSYGYPTAEFMITEVDSRGHDIKGVSVKHATLYLKNGVINYSLPDGNYRGEIVINNVKVWQKKFTVISGEKNDNYNGKDYEFKLGFNINRVDYNSNSSYNY